MAGDYFIPDNVKLVTNETDWFGRSNPEAIHVIRLSTATDGGRYQLPHLENALRAVQNRDEGQFSWLKARTIQYNCGI
jgi:hypothetical protein